jgi:hypothetical protein
VFNGLALAIIFGIVASTLFTLVVVPAVYLLVYDDAPSTHDGHADGGRTMNIKNGMAAAGPAAS